MRVRCPHCQNPLEIVCDEADREVVCPSCGSSLNDVEETLVRVRREIRQLGHYELLELVGRGYFGEVWRARNKNLGQTVALKMPRTQDLDDDTIRMFLREARAAAKLRHPNIVTVHDVDRQDDIMYIVSDFIQGSTLADLIKTRRLAPREAAELCLTIAGALQHAHEQGVIHRDLKPRNILLDENEQPYVTDFGLAKDDASEITMTMTGDVLGTPAYMPPEQASGHSRDADARSDVYSLGVVFYEMLTGKRPFHGTTRVLLRQILTEEPEWPSRVEKQVPRDLETICLKAMQKEPRRRYSSAEEMADDLRRFLNGEPIAARRVTGFERTWRWARRNPAIPVSLAVSAAAVMLMVLLIVRENSRGAAQAEDPPPVLRQVMLTSDPPGADVVFFPLDTTTDEPLYDQAVRPEEATPLRIELAPGDYLVVAVSDEDGFSFHEVRRRVPVLQPDLPDRRYKHTRWELLADGVVELPYIEIPLDNVDQQMVRLDGADAFIMGAPQLTESPPHARRVPAFRLDTTEVSVEAFVEIFRLPPWQLRDDPPPPSHAVSYVTFDQALTYAEKVGKRLPLEAEYEFAATAEGARNYPWGDDAERMQRWDVGDVGTPEFDRLDVAGQPIFGLYSNVAEWTGSRFTLYPQHIRLGLPAPQQPLWVVRGGPVALVNETDAPADWQRGPRTRAGFIPQTMSARLGFRCARSVRPRLTADDFIRIVNAAPAP